MNLCAEGHEEIVYGKGKCPLCGALQTISGLEKELEELHEAKEA